MSPDTQFSRSLRRRRISRTATAAALLLIAETAFTAGGVAVAAPAGPEVASPQTHQPSEEEVLASDMAWAAQHAKGSKAWAVLEAKKTGKKVVVTDETTPTAYTVANPDGSLTTELTTGPERIWRDGEWQKVDATLALTADGGVTAKSHPKGLRLAGRGGTKASSLAAARNAAARDLVTLGSGDEAVTLQWKGGLPAPVLNGTTARYPGAVPGADVIVEATRTGFEQFVEIAERPSAGDYSYTLPVRAKGLTAKANNDGSVSFADARTGEVRATMPAPMMWDASVDERSGKHENRARVGMKVVDKGHGAVDLVVTPDAKFLADPGTTYPVTVDPSTSALGNLFDTYVQQGETVDWSADTELDLGNPGTKNPDGTYRTARSFITWNTAPIADALVSSATLSLWNFHSGNTDCTAQPWEVWTANNASTSSRWTNQPAMAAKYATSTATRGNPGCSAADGWITADVTTLAQYWAGQQWNVSGMGLRASSESDALEWKRVNSANNTANQPKLTVTYNYRPSDGTSRQAGAPFKSYAGVWAVNTTTPALRDTFTDQDGDQVNGTFQVYDAATNTPITTPLGEGLLLSPYGDQGKPVSVTVPAGQLTDGRTYKFRTNAYDGTHYNLNWSPWTQFVVDTTAPDEPSPVVSSTYPEGSYGGGGGTPGTWTATTASDANRLQYRIDGEDPDPDAGAAGRGTWQTVNTTTTTGVTTAGFASTPTTNGAHHVETRAVDRADNTGAANEYGFIAGTAPTGRARKVDITLNTPDPAAPDPADWNNPYPAFGWNGWETQTSSGTVTQNVPPLLATSKKTMRAGDATITMTPLKQRTPAAAKAITTELQRAQQQRKTSMSAAAAGYTGPLLDSSWCDTTLVGQKSFIRRTEACLLFTWGVEGNNGTKDYDQLYELMWQFKLDPKGNTIKHWVQMTPLLTPVTDQWPSSPKALSFSIFASCVQGGCADTDSSFAWETDRSPTWSSGADTHLAQGNAETTWDGSVANAAGLQDKDLSRVIPNIIQGIFSTDTPNMLVTDNHGTSPGSIPARCDKVYGTGGCVIADYSPGYAMNSKKFPAAAAHAWLVQSKLAPEFFGRTPVTPLHYLPGRSPTDRTKFRNAAGADQKGRSETANRYRVCSGAAANKMVYHPATALHPSLSSSNKDIRSCDEYSFNATYESAGMPTTEGGLNPKPVSDALQGRECVQTYETKLPDGTFRLYDDERFAAPTWQETCGRSSMSVNVNSQSMSRFGSFASTFRLLDKDTYWVDIAGFDKCDPLADVIKCAQTP
ncbi:DNRLRE domain-containing protein [Streptomyces sp. NPDC059352]|uniref:DNRLRE domain-containing protein n=1 Tax=Streptomyces sp. NPDC059352 TaxID=3346810 RepID=UPI00369D8B33